MESPKKGEETGSNELLALAAEAEPHLDGPHRVEWEDRLEAEHAGFRQSFDKFLRHGKGAEALRLVADLWGFQEDRGHAAEARVWLEKALAAPGAEDRTDSRCRALYGAGFLPFRNLDDTTAQRRFEECLSIAKERRMVKLIVRSSTGLSRLALRKGDTQAGRRLSEEALAVARELGEESDQSTPLHMLAATARIERNFGLARQFYRENLELNRRLRRLGQVSIELVNLGAINVLDGDTSLAEPSIREGLTMACEMKNHYLVPYGLIWMGRVALALGDARRAATLLAAGRAQLLAAGLELDPDEAPEFESGKEAARAAMDKSEFSTAWSKGTEMTLDAAVGFALHRP